MKEDVYVSEGAAVEQLSFFVLDRVLLSSPVRL